MESILTRARDLPRYEGSARRPCESVGLPGAW